MATHSSSFGLKIVIHSHIVADSDKYPITYESIIKALKRSLSKKGKVTVEMDASYYPVTFSVVPRGTK